MATITVYIKNDDLDLFLCVLQTKEKHTIEWSSMQNFQFNTEIALSPSEFEILKTNFNKNGKEN